MRTIIIIIISRLLPSKRFPGARTPKFLGGRCGRPPAPPHAPDGPSNFVFYPFSSRPRPDDGPRPSVGSPARVSFDYAPRAHTITIITRAHDNYVRYRRGSQIGFFLPTLVARLSTPTTPRRPVNARPSRDSFRFSYAALASA